MFQGLLTSLKELLDIDPNKRSLIMSWIFCGVIIYFIYDRYLISEEKLNTQQASCQAELVKQREFYENQLKVNRENSQKEITEFTIKSNIERDSIYRYFYKELRKSNKIVQSSINELNTLKDESNH